METPPKVAELSFGMSKKKGTKRQKMTLNGPTARRPVNSTEFSSRHVRANVRAASMHVEKMKDVRRYVKNLLVPYRRSKVLQENPGKCQGDFFIDAWP